MSMTANSGSRAIPSNNVNLSNELEELLSGI
jgi:hypothetical protein